MRKTSIISGYIKADEIPHGEGVDDVASTGSDTTISSGGASIPIPYFGTGGTTYWEIDPLTDEDTDGKTVKQNWVVPTGIDKLTVFYKVIKKDGTYGKTKKWPESDFSDAEVASGYISFIQDRLKARKSFDILKATAHVDGTRAVNPTSDPDPNTGLPTGLAPVGTAPQETGGFPPGAFTPSLPASVLARVIPGDYMLSKLRVTAIGSAVKEPGHGVFWPVTIKFTAGSYLQYVKLRYERVGRRRTSGGSGSSGQNTLDTSVYGAKSHFTIWHELTDDERAAGTAIIHVGPFNARQALRTWHITRIVGHLVVDEANGDKIVKEKYPSDTANLSSSPTDTIPVNSVNAISYPNTGAVPTSDGSNPFPTGAAMLGIMFPDSPITSVPTDPSATYLAAPHGRNQPDLDTEKDSDAIIEARCFLDKVNNLATASNTNVDSVTFVFAFRGDEANPTRWKHFNVPVEPDDVSASIQFHRRIGRPMVWIKNVLHNAISKSTSTGAAYNFIAGNSGYVGPNALDGVSVVMNPIAAGDDDSSSVTGTATVSNNATVLKENQRSVLKKAIFYTNRRGTSPSSPPSDANALSGDSNWKIDHVMTLRDNPEVQGVSPVTLRNSWKTRRKQAIKLCVKISVVGVAGYVDSNVISYTTNSDLPVSNYAHGHKNIIIGGAFMFSSLDYNGGGASDADLGKLWRRAPGGASTRINTTVSATEYYWDRTNHRVIKPSGSTTDLCTKVRRLFQPGEVLTFSFLMKSGGAVFPQVSIALVDDNNNVIAVSSTYTPSSSVGTSYEMHSLQITIPSTYTLAANVGLYFRFRVANAVALFLDNFMLVRGNQALTWDSAAADDEVDANGGAITISDTGSGTFDANAGGGNNGIGGAGGRINL